MKIPVLKSAGIFLFNGMQYTFFMLFIFDMGGVVTNTAGRTLFEKICSHLDMELPKFLEIMGWKTENDLFLDLDNGKITAKEWWKIFEQRSEIKVNCDWFRLLFHPVMNEETKKLVLDLKAKGHRVVCGTNTIESHYDNHMCRGDYAIFDMTYASIHMGVSKPDPKFWELILECENEKAENAFFTDDKAENIEGAKSVGISVVRFESAEKLREQWKKWL